MSLQPETPDTYRESYSTAGSDPPVAAMSGPETLQEGHPLGPEPEESEAQTVRAEAITNASRQTQEALALFALEAAKDEMTENPTRANLRAKAAEIYASLAERPEDFYDVMDGMEDKHSGESCDTKESRQRATKHYRDRVRDRLMEAIGAPEGEEAIGHHIKALDYCYTSSGPKAEKIKQFNPIEGEVEVLNKTKWVPGRFSISPKAVIWTASVTGYELDILVKLYDLAHPYFFHANEEFRVVGMTQGSLANHLDLSLRHTHRLMKGLEAMGLIRIRSHARNYAPGADAMYFLHAHEPCWFEFPAGSPFSGRARVQKYANAKPNEINWTAVRNNEWLRVQDTDSEPYEAESEGGETRINERHRSATVKSTGDGQPSESPQGMSAGLYGWLMERMPESAREKFEQQKAPDGVQQQQGPQEDDVSLEASFDSVSGNGATSNGETPHAKDDTQDDDGGHEPSTGPQMSFDEALRRLKETWDGEITPDVDRMLRAELRRTRDDGEDGTEDPARGDP